MSIQRRAKASESKRELFSKVAESSSQYFSSATSQSSLSPSSTSSSNFEDQPAPDFVELKAARKILTRPKLLLL